MSKHALVAALFLIVGLVTAQAVNRLEAVARADQARDATPHLLRADVSPRLPDAAPGTAALPRLADGHYWADARVNGVAVRFMIDTGATTVALPAELARQLGVIGSSVLYDQKVNTANGSVNAASVYLDTVDVGGVQIHHVEALIVERGLDIPLLGMSYLNRLSKLEVTPTQLVLHR